MLQLTFIKKKCGRKINSIKKFYVKKFMSFEEQKKIVKKNFKLFYNFMKGKK